MAVDEMLLVNGPGNSKKILGALALDHHMRMGTAPHQIPYFQRVTCSLLHFKVLS